MRPPRPHVTDHAMLRYLERVVGIDVDSHRRALEARVALAVELGASALISEGHRYCLVEHRLTTVKLVQPPPRHSQQREERE